VVQFEIRRPGKILNLTIITSDTDACRIFIQVSVKTRIAEMISEMREAAVLAEVMRL
jgi:hypothetical protein